MTLVVACAAPSTCWPREGACVGWTKERACREDLLQEEKAFHIVQSLESTSLSTASRCSVVVVRTTGQAPAFCSIVAADCGKDSREGENSIAIASHVTSLHQHPWIQETQLCWRCPEGGIGRMPSSAPVTHPQKSTLSLARFTVRVHARY